MKNRVADFLRKCDVRSILMLCSGIIIAQVISYLVAPVLTRLYTPEAFGTFSVITSITSAFIPVVTLQYDQFIVIVSSEDEADKLVALSIYLTFVISIIITAGLFIYTCKTKNHVIQELNVWIYISIPILFFNSLINIITAYNNRLGEYKTISQANIIRTVFQNSIKLLFGFADKNHYGLAGGVLLGSLAGIKKQAECLRHRWRKILKTNLKDLLIISVKYKEQPFFSMPGFFISSLSYSILPIIISALYDSEEVGYFSLTMSMLGVPLNLISESVGKVFLKKASEEKKYTGQFLKSYVYISVLLLIIALPLFILIYLIAEPAFSIVFGTQWIRSGTFVKVFAVLYFVRFIVSVLNQGLIISGRQLIKLIIQILFIIEAITGYLLAKKYSFDIISFLRFISISYTINYIVMWLAGLFVSGKRKGE